MLKAIVNKNRCKACGLCTGVCPKKIISIDSRIITPYGKGCAVISAGCIGCKNCVTVCPDIAITILKEVNDEKVNER